MNSSSSDSDEAPNNEVTVPPKLLTISKKADSDSSLEPPNLQRMQLRTSTLDHVHYFNNQETVNNMHSDIL